MMHPKIISVLVFISALVFGIALATPTAIAASLTSTVDRNIINKNEALVLTVKLDQQAETSELDLNLLTNDFEVLRVNPLNSTAFTLDNGKTTQVVTTQWTIQLLPKREGLLKIPSFSVANAKSEAITINVEPATTSGTANNASSDAPLIVKVTASEAEAYPKQQIILTVQLSAKADVSSLDGTPLTIENAEIRELGQASGESIDNGVARNVIQLKYAVFAKQAGTLTIPVMSFSGVQGGSRSFFSNRGKRVIARSEPLTIPIKQAPESADIWLPSQTIELSSELSGDPSQYQVGSPITRKVIIKAQGLTAEAIPPMSGNTIANKNAAKSYEDKPQLHTTASDSGVIGTRIESMAIVPSLTGELKLPELRLNWWNVAEEQWQQAILPAETLIIGGTTNSTADVEPQLGTSQIDPERPASNTTEIKNNHPFWQLLSALLLLICIAQFALLKRQSSNLNHDDMNQTPDQNEHQAWQHLNTVLKLGQVNEIRTGLLKWASASNPTEEYMTLSALSKKANSAELSAALNRLEAHLFAEDKGEINQDDIDSIRISLTKLRQKNSKKRNTAHTTKSTLKPLYPN